MNHPREARSRRRRGAILGIPAALLLAACAGPQPTAPAPVACPPRAPVQSCPPAPPPATAAQAVPPLQPAQWSELPGWREDDLSAAWPVFLASCSKLVRQAAWREVCAAASALGSAPSAPVLAGFFESRLRPWRAVNSDASRDGLVTGYYEPLIRGSRTRSARYVWPVWGVPSDLLTIALDEVYPETKGMRLRGRIEGNRVLPYWSRGEIERRARQGSFPAPVLLWAEDPIDLFFLQVQGSGRVQLPDGSLVRIGYADQNGQPYRSIGRWLVDHGELALSQASMDGIKGWVRAHPERLNELLDVNPRYVFLREMPDGKEGPLGSLGLPLTPGRSIAVDASAIPLGAPVFLSTTEPLSSQPLNRLMFAQDTGGAIKGVVRADFFWGFGDEAGRLAGGMRQSGAMWVLLPRGMQPGAS